MIREFFAWGPLVLVSALLIYSVIEREVHGDPTNSDPMIRWWWRRR